MSISTQKQDVHALTLEHVRIKRDIESLSLVLGTTKMLRLGYKRKQIDKFKLIRGIYKVKRITHEQYYKEHRAKYANSWLDSSIISHTSLSKVHNASRVLKSKDNRVYQLLYLRVEDKLYYKIFDDKVENKSKILGIINEATQHGDKPTVLRLDRKVNETIKMLEDNNIKPCIVNKAHANKLKTSIYNVKVESMFTMIKNMLYDNKALMLYLVENNFNEGKEMLESLIQLIHYNNTRPYLEFITTRPTLVNLLMYQESITLTEIIERVEINQSVKAVTNTL